MTFTSPQPASFIPPHLLISNRAPHSSGSVIPPFDTSGGPTRQQIRSPVVSSGTLGLEADEGGRLSFPFNREKARRDSDNQLVYSELDVGVCYSMPVVPPPRSVVTGSGRESDDGAGPLHLLFGRGGGNPIDRDASASQSAHRSLLASG
jgi:hypothetical protein